MGFADPLHLKDVLEAKVWKEYATAVAVTTVINLDEHRRQCVLVSFYESSRIRVHNYAWPNYITAVNHLISQICILMLCHNKC